MKARLAFMVVIAAMLGVYVVSPAGATETDGAVTGMQRHEKGGAPMAARTPAEVHTLWLAAINAGDIEGLLALYEPNATAVFGPGQVATGTEGIRAGLLGLLALKPHFELRVDQVLQSGDTALLLSPYTLVGTGPDGAKIEAHGATSDVVRKQPDGTWRFIIDNPTGSEGLVY